MKNFNRSDRLFSLCGLNCGLCPMRLGGYCPGCGGGEGNQACAIAKCSLEQDRVEYCFLCKAFPCEKYERIDQFDSFITHKNQRTDIERARQIGMDAYRLEQEEKIRALDFFLANYNDGRKKTLFCIAVNLLDLQDIKAILKQLAENTELNSLPLKERSAYAAGLFQDLSKQRNIELKLRKK